MLQTAAFMHKKLKPQTYLKGMKVLSCIGVKMPAKSLDCTVNSDIWNFSLE